MSHTRSFFNIDDPHNLYQDFQIVDSNPDFFTTSFVNNHIVDSYGIDIINYEVDNGSDTPLETESNCATTSKITQPILNYTNGNENFIVVNQSSISIFEADFFVENESDINNANLYNLSNYPNPFNSSVSGRSLGTTINYSVPKTSEINLSIYNLKGQRVKTLEHGTVKKGKHQVVWDGLDTSNKKVSSGIYLYKLRIDEQRAESKKCLLLK